VSWQPLRPRDLIPEDGSLPHLEPGRSFNDLAQWPVFPWILRNYVSRVRGRYKSDGGLNGGRMHGSTLYSISNHPSVSHISNQSPEPVIGIIIRALLRPWILTIRPTTATWVSQWGRSIPCGLPSSKRGQSVRGWRSYSQGGLGRSRGQSV